MEPPSPSEALYSMFAGGEAELEADDGTALPMSLTLIREDRASGRAPRLRVGAGRRLSGRANTADGESWLVGLEVEVAQYATPDLADVSVRVVSIEPHPHRRRAMRVPAGGSAWLEALNCQEVVDGDRVDGVMVDVSELGVALSTDRLLRSGDRLYFHGRFFAQTIECEVRVASVRAIDGGRRIAGCSFVDMDVETRERLGRVVRGERETPAVQLDLRSLRDAAEPSGGGLFGRMRRRA